MAINDDVVSKLNALDAKQWADNPVIKQNEADEVQKEVDRNHQIHGQGRGEDSEKAHSLELAPENRIPLHDPCFKCFSESTLHLFAYP